MDVRLRNLGSEVDISQTTYLVECIIFLNYFLSKAGNATSLAYRHIIISHINCGIYCFTLNLF